MTDTPNISVSSSDKNLNQRFRKPKSNLLVFVLVGVLGVALVATPFLLSGGNEKEKEKEVVENKPALKPKPKLTKASFGNELQAGEVATVELKGSLENAEISQCKVEWNIPGSTLPEAVIQNVKVDDQLTVSIPTAELKNGSAKKGNNEWKLVGKVLSKEGATSEFTINLKIKFPNSPPAAGLPSVVNYDPILGADIRFSVSDKESSAEDLHTSLDVSSRLESEFKIERTGDKATIQFRPSVYTVDKVSLQLEVKDPQGATSTFDVSLNPKPRSKLSMLVVALSKDGGIDFSTTKIERNANRTSLKMELNGEQLELAEDPLGGPLTGTPKMEEGRSRFQKDGVTAVCASNDQKLAAVLEKQLGPPIKPLAPTITANTKSANEKLLSTAKDLFGAKKLFQSKSFAELVFAFVDDFERENAEVLKRKYKELDGLESFLDSQKGLKAELFLAIDPAYDNLSSSLNVLNEIRKQHPKEIVPYKNLAIAIAVCWDVPVSNYSFVGHQRRTKSSMPENLTDAVANFKHFVTYQNQMQGRAQWLPWEFLVHVINHQTPDAEKYWALENYLQSRAQFGKCYKDVPYDYEMLNSKSQVCKLAGKSYSLPNIREHGGVCAMQADFAARVGKSLGVPSEYVGGQSAFGENHAWVMWVEIKNVTRSSIAFSLESFGRYRGDNYYVGHLKDPKSGKKISDRELELRLHTVGTDAYAKRHVDLIMKVFPELAKSQEMELKDQFKFLEQAIKMCPWHETAWKTVADLISTEDIDKKMNRQMNQILNSMFVHFAAFPDFTWEIFHRLVSFVPKGAEQNKYYVKLLNLYVAAKRPDLACEAQLVLTDLLEDQAKTEIAMKGLANTIKVFPDEGRYVPKLLSRLEDLVGTDPELINQLIQFHAEFLPLIPQKRGNRPSKYCLKMYQQAIEFFKKHGATDYAALYSQKYSQLNSSSQ